MIFDQKVDLTLKGIFLNKCIKYCIIYIMLLYSFYYSIFLFLGLRDP